jgi:L-ascorbate metabolism protein UlaG (beta-lactamase superfamily)
MIAGETLCADSDQRPGRCRERRGFNAFELLQQLLRLDFAMQTSKQTQVRRLNWAGVEIVHGHERVLIDPLENTAPFEALLGKPRHPFQPVPDFDGTTTTLVTHLHYDHADRGLLKRLDDQGGRLVAHRAIASELNAIGLTVEPADHWQTKKFGAFRVTAIPAVDWRGDDQVSWVVEVDGHAYFHGGDGTWHGYWYRTAQIFGRFDAVFLPVNGVLFAFPGVPSTGIPGTLLPDQAVIATRVLNGAQLVPIHYHTFNNRPLYVEQTDIPGQLTAAAAREGVKVNLVAENQST